MGLLNWLLNIFDLVNDDEDASPLSYGGDYISRNVYYDVKAPATFDDSDDFVSRNAYYDVKACPIPEKNDFISRNAYYDVKVHHSNSKNEPERLNAVKDLLNDCIKSVEEDIDRTSYFSVVSMPLDSDSDTRFFSTCENDFSERSSMEPEILGQEICDLNEVDAHSFLGIPPTHPYVQILREILSLSLPDISEESQSSSTPGSSGRTSSSMEDNAEPAMESSVKKGFIDNNNEPLLSDKHNNEPLTALKEENFKAHSNPELHSNSNNMTLPNHTPRRISLERENSSTHPSAYEDAVDDGLQSITRDVPIVVMRKKPQHALDETGNKQVTKVCELVSPVSEKDKPNFHTAIAANNDEKNMQSVNSKNGIPFNVLANPENDKSVVPKKQKAPSARGLPSGDESIQKDGKNDSESSTPASLIFNENESLKSSIGQDYAERKPSNNTTEEACLNTPGLRLTDKEPAQRAASERGINSKTETLSESDSSDEGAKRKFRKVKPRSPMTKRKKIDSKVPDSAKIKLSNNVETKDASTNTPPFKQLFEKFIESISTESETEPEFTNSRKIDNGPNVKNPESQSKSISHVKPNNENIIGSAKQKPELSERKETDSRPAIINPELQMESNENGKTNDRSIAPFPESGSKSNDISKTDDVNIVPVSTDPESQSGSNEINKTNDKLATTGPESHSKLTDSVDTDDAHRIPINTGFKSDSKSNESDKKNDGSAITSAELQLKSNESDKPAGGSVVKSPEFQSKRSDINETEGGRIVPISTSPGLQSGSNESDKTDGITSPESQSKSSGSIKPEDEHIIPISTSAESESITSKRDKTDSQYAILVTGPQSELSKIRKMVDECAIPTPELQSELDESDKTDGGPIITSPELQPESNKNGKRGDGSTCTITIPEPQLKSNENDKTDNEPSSTTRSVVTIPDSQSESSQNLNADDESTIIGPESQLKSGESDINKANGRYIIPISTSVGSQSGSNESGKMDGRPAITSTTDRNKTDDRYIMPIDTSPESESITSENGQTDARSVEPTPESQSESSKSRKSGGGSTISSPEPQSKWDESDKTDGRPIIRSSVSQSELPFGTSPESQSESNKSDKTDGRPAIASPESPSGGNETDDKRIIPISRSHESDWHVMTSHESRPESSERDKTDDGTTTPSSEPQLESCDESDKTDGRSVITGPESQSKSTDGNKTGASHIMPFSKSPESQSESSDKMDGTIVITSPEFQPKLSDSNKTDGRHIIPISISPESDRCVVVSSECQLESSERDKINDGSTISCSETQSKSNESDEADDRHIIPVNASLESQSKSDERDEIDDFSSKKPQSESGERDKSAGRPAITGPESESKSNESHEPLPSQTSEQLVVSKVVDIDTTPVPNAKLFNKDQIQAFGYYEPEGSTNNQKPESEADSVPATGIKKDSSDDLERKDTSNWSSIQVEGSPKTDANQKAEKLCSKNSSLESLIEQDSKLSKQENDASEKTNNDAGKEDLYFSPRTRHVAVPIITYPSSEDDANSDLRPLAVVDAENGERHKISEPGNSFQDGNEPHLSLSTSKADIKKKTNGDQKKKHSSISPRAAPADERIDASVSTEDFTTPKMPVSPENKNILSGGKQTDEHSEPVSPATKETKQDLKKRLLNDLKRDTSSSPHARVESKPKTNHVLCDGDVYPKVSNALPLVTEGSTQTILHYPPAVSKQFHFVLTPSTDNSSGEDTEVIKLFRDKEQFDKHAGDSAYRQPLSGLSAAPRYANFEGQRPLSSSSSDQNSYLKPATRLKPTVPARIRATTMPLLPLHTTTFHKPFDFNADNKRVMSNSFFTERKFISHRAIPRSTILDSSTYPTRPLSTNTIDYNQKRFYIDNVNDNLRDIKKPEVKTSNSERSFRIIPINVKNTPQNCSSAEIARSSSCENITNNEKDSSISSTGSDDKKLVPVPSARNNIEEVHRPIFQDTFDSPDPFNISFPNSTYRTYNQSFMHRSEYFRFTNFGNRPHLERNLLPSRVPNFQDYNFFK